MSALSPTTNHEEIRAWATRHLAVPCEVLPHRVDGEPALLRFLFQEQARERLDVTLISWDEFFLKFDALGLTFVYEEGTREHHEILQMEEKSPYRPPAYKRAKFED